MRLGFVTGRRRYSPPRASEVISSTISAERSAS